jgi:prophage maintenance system killer protein
VFLFLELNGFNFEANEPDATQAVTSLAAGTLDEARCSAWLEEHVRLKRKSQILFPTRVL